MLRQALDAYKRLPEPAPQELRDLLFETIIEFAVAIKKEVSCVGCRDGIKHQAQSISANFTTSL